MKQVVIASNNAHKIDEIKNALAIADWEYISLSEAGFQGDIVEDADSFVGNAAIKAHAVHEALSCAVLADDSGLAVDALNGAPGVYSARYAGEHGNDAANNEKLLQELDAVAGPDRSARFVCALVFVDEDGSETSVTGSVEGYIGHYARGEEGFGYDPLFLPEAYEGKKSFAELTQEEKSAISHRGSALAKLKEKISK